MKKLLLNRKPLRNTAYGGGNLFVIAMCDCARDNGWEITHKIEDDIDALFLMDPRYDELGISINELVDYKAINNVPIIHRVNECDSRKNTTDMDPLLSECSKYTDTTVFVSQWMKDYHHQKGWHCKDEEQKLKNYVIYNGVNKQHFKPNKKINNGKINIFIAHWSNNILKNVFTHKIDEFVGKHKDEYTFTYIGRPPSGLKNTKIISPLFGEKLGEEIAKYDVCINSSKADPASNSIMESIACGIPTYAWSEGGGSLELVGNDHVFSSWEEAEKILLSKKFERNEGGYQPIDWEDCARRYYDVINYTLEADYEKTAIKKG